MIGEERTRKDALGNGTHSSYAHTHVGRVDDGAEHPRVLLGFCTGDPRAECLALYGFEDDQTDDIVEVAAAANHVVSPAGLAVTREGGLLADASLNACAKRLLVGFGEGRRGIGAAARGERGEGSRARGIAAVRRGGEGRRVVREQLRNEFASRWPRNGAHELHQP